MEWLFTRAIATQRRGSRRTSGPRSERHFGKQRLTHGQLVDRANSMWRENYINVEPDGESSTKLKSVSFANPLEEYEPGTKPELRVRWDHQLTNVLRRTRKERQGLRLPGSAYHMNTGPVCGDLEKHYEGMCNCEVSVYKTRVAEMLDNLLSDDEEFLVDNEETLYNDLTQGEANDWEQWSERSFARRVMETRVNNRNDDTTMPTLEHPDINELYEFNLELSK